jgi:aminoglycoside phosphotransferase (APT) family kinase protein
VLTLVPVRAGGSSHRDRDGSVWRTYRYVEGARTFETGHRPEIARAAARAFGRFARELGGLDPSAVVETIPRFHDLRLRLERLFAAADDDRAGRASRVVDDLDFVRRRADLAEQLERLRREDGLPARVVHNDTKVNNVLIDDATGEGVCVLDLDTVMPGSLLYDYGDLVRTATSRASEDAGEAAPVHVELDLFEAVTDGYLSETARFAAPVEIESFLLGAHYMTLIIGVRFLTDHLEGDPYFRTSRPDQNLDRWRTQRRLLESLEQQEERLAEIVQAAARRHRS